MSRKCPACNGERTVLRGFDRILCSDCLASGNDLTLHRPLVIKEDPNYAVTTASPRLDIKKKGRPRKNGTKF